MYVAVNSYARSSAR